MADKQEDESGNHKAITQGGEKEGEKEGKEDMTKKRRGRPKKADKEKEGTSKDKVEVTGMNNFLESGKIAKGKELIRTPIKTKEGNVDKEEYEEVITAEEGDSSDGSRERAVGEQRQSEKKSERRISEHSRE